MLVCFRKKTTLQAAIEEANVDLDHKLLQGSAADRIKLARAEAYAIKCMMLDITQSSRSVVSGSKISAAVHALIKKFKNSKDNSKPGWGVPSLPVTSPVRPMKSFEDTRAHEAAQPTSDPSSSSCNCSAVADSVADSNSSSFESNVCMSSGSVHSENPITQRSASQISLVDRLFPLELDEAMDSQGSGVDIVAVTRNVPHSTIDKLHAIGR